MAKDLIVKASVEINAPAWRVWEVLTKPEYTKKYMFGCSAESDWKEGSALNWRGNINGKDTIVVKGTITEIEPGKYLAYTTFDPNMGLEDTPANYLTVTETLTENNGKTTLAVTQGNFNHVQESERRYTDCIKGWEMVLPIIKHTAEEHMS
ncbi:MAG: SRPBCC domain-containing protein [Chitinophagales bacterium]